MNSRERAAKRRIKSDADAYRAARIAATDALMVEAASEHNLDTGHTTETFPGAGWGCRVCDPDLFETPAETSIRESTGWYSSPGYAQGVLTS